MFGVLGKIDKKVIGEFVDSINQSSLSIPAEYRSTFSRIAGSAEFFYIFRHKFLEKMVMENESKLRVLIVGLHGGRDYWHCVAEGFDVSGMDINEFGFPNSVVANAEDTWPYDTNAFDVVIMGEVLEHLFYDKEALKEANRVLVDRGKLIITDEMDTPVSGIALCQA